jgi:competence protein ComEC
MTPERTLPPARAGLPLAWWWPAALGGWVLGTVAVVGQPRLWAVDVYKVFGALALFLIALAALFFVVFKRRGTAPGSPGRMAVLAAGGLMLLAAAGLTGQRAWMQQTQWLPPEWEGQTLLIEGRVAAVPTATPLGWRVLLDVQRTLSPNAPTPERVLLFWPLTGVGPAPTTIPGPHADEVWRLSVRLRRPHGLANPHGFDSELWMWEQGLAATGSVRQGRADPPPQRLAAAGWGLQPLREAVRDRIHHTLQADAAPTPAATPSPQAAHPERQRVAAVLSALVMGDQSAIAQPDWDVFRATGVGHLVSVSGLHITLWAWLMSLAVARLWRALPRWAPVWGVRLLWRCPAPTAAAWGGLVLAAAYAAFAGWGVPAQRTLVMLAVATLLRQGARRWPAPLVMGTALAGVLAWDPWAVLQAGFWLSFGAVAVLMSTDTRPMPPVADLDGPDAPAPSSPWAHRWQAVKDAVHTQTRLTAVLAPLTLLLFGQVSVVGWLANLVAIPAVTLLITPLALAGVLWSGLWTLAAGVLEAGMAGLAWLSTWPGASVQAAVPPLGWGVLAVLGAWVAILPWPPGVRVLGLLALLPALLWQAPRPAWGQFELLAADVGQGSAVLIRTAHASVLYDAGPRWGPGSDAGQRVLLPLLAALGEQPRHLVLSHRDADHVGGAPALLRTWPQLQVWASFAPQALAGVADWPDQPPAHWHACVAGPGWTQDGVRFEWLHPPPDLVLPERDTNNRSCVLRVQGQGAAALLTGDLDARHEAALVARVAHGGEPSTDLKADLKADLLMAPHHGSRHSSSPALLQAVQPRWVVAQAGYRNRYGHPAPEVLARYQAQGVPWRASPDCGAARWRSDQPERLHCWRDESPRHWQPMAQLHAPGRDSPADEDAAPDGF